MGNPTKVIVKQYYYRGDKDTNIGPLEEDELEQFYTAGIIDNATMVIEVGLDKWQRYDATFLESKNPQQAERAWTPPELISDGITSEQISPIEQEKSTRVGLPPLKYDPTVSTRLIVGEDVPPERFPELPDQKEPIIRSAICPFCTKRFNAIGWEFVDKIYTCPFCNNEAAAKEFVGYKKNLTLPPLTIPVSKTSPTLAPTAASTAAAPAIQFIDSNEITTHSSVTPVSDVLRASEIVEIAKRQKQIIWMIMLSFIAMVIPYATLLTGVILIYFIFKLAKAIRSPDAAGYIILAFIPFIGVIALAFLNSKATKILQANGIKVGFFGAKATDLEKLR